MQCVNHPEVAATTFCQNCGKALCDVCIERTPAGQVFCAVCRATGGAVPPMPYPPPSSGPNPGLAAFLGLLPGVGAMYNGQFFKGMVHVLIFAVLVTLTDRYDIVGIFIAAWMVYQSFEAYHTARARRDGLPLPDPFGLNEMGNWINFGSHSSHPGSVQRGPVVGPGMSVPPATPYSAPYAPPSASPGASGPGSTVPGSSAASGAPPFTEPYIGTTPPWVDPSLGYPPPPVNGLHSVPTGAIVLIALGILFLLHSMGFVPGIMRFAWPLLLIGMGVWLIIRRIGIGGPRS